MFLLIVYDIDFREDKESGKDRLRRVATLCERYGIRVQSSVFELDVSPSELVELKSKLKNIISTNEDSVRIYKLGDKRRAKVEILGKREKVEISTDNALIV